MRFADLTKHLRDWALVFTGLIIAVFARPVKIIEQHFPVVKIQSFPGAGTGLVRVSMRISEF